MHLRSTGPGADLIDHCIALALVSASPLYAAMEDFEDGFWIFAYGSLLWKPGFDVAESRPAVLSGYRRAFCLWSIHYRGTEDFPGLVLGLDEDAGARTRGLALKVAPDRARETYQYIRDRELISYAYRELWCELETENGSVPAVTYVIDHDHTQYCPPKSLEAQAEIIARASGSTGTNADYLFETNKRLAALGQSDPDLIQLEKLVRAL